MSRRTGFLIAGGVVVLILVVATVSAVTRSNEVAGTASPAPTGSAGGATSAPSPVARTKRGADYLARTEQLGVPDNLAAAMGTSACQSVEAGLSDRQIVEMTASGVATYEQTMGVRVPLGVEPDLVATAFAVLCPGLHR